MHFPDKLEIHFQGEGVLLLPPASKAGRRAPDVQKTHSPFRPYHSIRTRSVDCFDAIKCARSVMTSAAMSAYCSAACRSFTSRSPQFSMFLMQLLQFDGQWMQDSHIILSPVPRRGAWRIRVMLCMHAFPQATRQIILRPPQPSYPVTAPVHTAREESEESSTGPIRKAAAASAEPDAWPGGSGTGVRRLPHCQVYRLHQVPRRQPAAVFAQTALVITTNEIASNLHSNQVADRCRLALAWWQSKGSSACGARQDCFIVTLIVRTSAAASI